MKTDPEQNRSPGSDSLGASYRRHVCDFLPRLHRDEGGTISIITVFAVMLFTMLLGMVINVGRHVDDKVKLQNAADTATMSGGVVLARGMNTIAFSNHLLFDIFALTAFMREAHDRNAEALTPDVLAAWSTVAPIFQKSPFEKFQGLGSGIPEKIEAEREMVRAFGDFAESMSDMMLKTLEGILSDKLIPRFQEAVVQLVPAVAQQTGNAVAGRPHMQNYPQREDPQLKSRGLTYGVLWRLNPQFPQPCGQSDELDPSFRTLPAVNPDVNGHDYRTVPNAILYLQKAQEERKLYSEKYLVRWNEDPRPDPWGVDWVGNFQLYAQMSQFHGLWEIFTHGQLCKLLNDEYPDTNLPFQIRRLDSGETPQEKIQSMNVPNAAPDWRPFQQYLEYNFRFGGVAYRKSLPEASGKLFVNQQTASAMSYAEVSLFIPLLRWVYFSNVDEWGHENRPTDWTLLSQNWTAQLVPATAGSFTQVLQTPPGQLAHGMSVPNFGAAGSSENLRRVNTH